MIWWFLAVALIWAACLNRAFRVVAEEMRLKQTNKRRWR